MIRAWTGGLKNPTWVGIITLTFANCLLSGVCASAGARSFPSTVPCWTGCTCVLRLCRILKNLIASCRCAEINKNGRTSPTQKSANGEKHCDTNKESRTARFGWPLDDIPPLSFPLPLPVPLPGAAIKLLRAAMAGFFPWYNSWIWALSCFSKLVWFRSWPVRLMYRSMHWGRYSCVYSSEFPLPSCRSECAMFPGGPATSRVRAGSPCAAAPL